MYFVCTLVYLSERCEIRKTSHPNCNEEVNIPIIVKMEHCPFQNSQQILTAVKKQVIIPLLLWSDISDGTVCLRQSFWLITTFWSLPAVIKIRAWCDKLWRTPVQRLWSSAPSAPLLCQRLLVLQQCIP